MFGWSFVGYLFVSVYLKYIRSVDCGFSYVLCDRVALTLQGSLTLGVAGGGPLGGGLWWGLQVDARSVSGGGRRVSSLG